MSFTLVSTGTVASLTAVVARFAAALLRGEVLESHVRGVDVRALRDVTDEGARWVCEIDGVVRTSGDPFDVAFAFATARPHARVTLPSPRRSFPALRDLPTEPRLRSAQG